ncbi:TIGR02678 family protein [Patulibacter sp. NPDC049589]|uniref:TIGR02678 family protein n=1 Tax=Patulibacter sp. NPDC049589 TaxID=3154731 RepID=UPI003419E3F3
MSTADALAAAADEERRRGLRALLQRQVLAAPDPDLGLVRRHRDHLATVVRDQLGGTLTVTSDTAHLSKVVTLDDARPLRLPPRSQSERAKPVDDRRALDGRAALLLCVVAGVLEHRGWTQVPLGALAEDVVLRARTLELEVDWRTRADRLALGDAIEFLTGLGVLTLRSGVAGEQGSDDEAFYDVHRRRLTLLIADPVRCAEAGAPADLEPRPADHGELAGRVRTRRIVRALVEDPVLYVDDLDPDDRDYFLSQRARLEGLARDLTGLQPERRREGTALIATGRELTDRPFPARGHVKQLALLLLPELCALDAANGSTVARETVDGLVRRLVTEHAAHWAWDPSDPADLGGARDRALAVLVDLRLAADEDGGLRVLPVAHRYRAAVGRRPTTAGTQLGLI